MGTRAKNPVITARRTGTRALGVAGAVAAAVAVWAVAALAFGIELQVTPGTTEPQPVGPGSVVVASLGASLAGWGLLALLERFTRRARTVWTTIAGVALVASVAPTLAGVTAAVTVSLLMMHLAVAAVLVTVLPRK